MSVSILSTALTGLSAYQQALNTTANNISNANTAGYSVEHVDFATQPELQTGSGFIGTGVAVTNISRSYNEFLNNQVLTSTAAYNNSNTYYTMASQVDNLLSNQTTGLSSAMSTFFNNANTVANNPSSIPSRQTFLSNANALAAQFNTISANFSTLNSQVNGNLASSVNQINNFAQTLAKLNIQIVSANNNGVGQTPNALMDQRDSLLNQISQLANVSIVKLNNGTTNLFLGQGQPLVLGGITSSLSVQNQALASDQKDIMLNGQDITNQINGGQIAGYLQFRSQVLVPAQQQLGLIATGLATEVNNIQKAGYDLKGNPGLPLFVLGTPTAEVQGQYGDPKLQVTANFVAPTSAANLGSAFELTVNSASPNSYTLTNLTDNTQVTGLDDTTLATTAAADGFSINFSGGSLTNGDTFQISPSYNIASSIQVNPALTNPNQIAASGTLAGVPGDNSNILALANLQNQAIMGNNTNTFSQVYGQLVSSVGTSTSNAQLNSTAQNTVLQNATTAQQSLSGVNLNEEAANLIKYQNAYQAAAKTVSVVQNLFTSILNAVN